MLVPVLVLKVAFAVTLLAGARRFEVVTRALAPDADGHHVDVPVGQIRGGRKADGEPDTPYAARVPDRGLGMQCDEVREWLRVGSAIAKLTPVVPPASTQGIPLLPRDGHGRALTWDGAGGAAGQRLLVRRLEEEAVSPVTAHVKAGAGAGDVDREIGELLEVAKVRCQVRVVAQLGEIFHQHAGVPGAPHLGRTI